MSKKPAPVSKLSTLEDLGLPSPADLQQAGVVSGAISKIIEQEEAFAGFHHKMIRYGIRCRYELALAIANDKNAFAIFARDERIKTLPRQPKSCTDKLQSLFQVTYSDRKKASKYYKRIEPFWEKRCPAAKVFAFLENNGVTPPPTKAKPKSGKPVSNKTASRPIETDDTSKTIAGETDNPIAPAVFDGDDPPSGTFHFWPGKIALERFYDLRVKVVDHDGETAVFELLDVSPAVVQ